MSPPYATLPRLPLLLLLVICGLLSTLSSRQGAVAAAASATTSSANEETATYTSPTCVPLQGIESNATGSLDPDDFLDLDVIKVSLKDEVFNITNPVLQKFAECAAGLETPIAMRILLGIDTAVFSMASMFHTNLKALDIFGDKETSDARRRCQPDENDADGQFLLDLHMRVTFMYTIMYAGLQAMPFCAEEIELLMEAQGHPLSFVMREETNVDTPWGLAKAYVGETIAYMLENDGWNADGSMSRDFNRIPYSDYTVKDSAGNIWTPYQPQNSPYKLTKPNRWQPLIESNGLGYLSTQEHVTPHIGVTARFFGFNSTEDEEAFASRELAKPEYMYRYEEVAREALNESAITAIDPFKQVAISFFDNKAASLVPLKALYFLAPFYYGLLALLGIERGNFTNIGDYSIDCTVNHGLVQRPGTLNIQDFYSLTVAAQLAVYNGVVLSWREKIRHDMPRPPTIVRDKLGDTLVQAYAGPGVGVQTMKASEWEPFIRTMPHSEFPSASSCLCQVFAEQVTNYVGDDEIKPSLEVGPFNFTSWSEISQVCGDSRVWGGMHFEGAVPAGVELCGGGDMAASIGSSIARLVDGDEGAAVFKRDIGQLMLRPL